MSGIARPTLLTAALMSLACASPQRPPSAPVEQRREAAFRAQPDRDEPPFDADSIIAMVGGRQDDIRQCYSSLLSSEPELSGRLEVRFQVLPDGSLASFEVLDDDTGSSALGQCVLGVLRTERLERGPEDGPLTVQFPFVFGVRDNR